VAVTQEESPPLAAGRVRAQGIYDEAWPGLQKGFFVAGKLTTSLRFFFANKTFFRYNAVS